MFLRGDYWHYDFIVGGKRYRGSTGFRKNEKSKAEAAEAKLKVQAREGHSIEMIWEQTKRQLIAGRDLALTVAAIWDVFAKRTDCAAGPKRMQAYKKRLIDFVGWMRENYPDVKKISAILPIQAQEYASFLRGQASSNSTKNDALMSLKLIFRTLGRDYGIVENPFGEVKRLPTSQVSREAFTPEELALIGKNAKGWIWTLCLTAISTGLREGDICTLKKSSVNLKDNYISIPHTKKTGVSVEIPILPALRKHILEQWEADPENEYVFPELYRRYTINNRIGRDIKRFFSEIGIVGATRKVEGYSKVSSVKDIHSFRHTFIYFAAVHGVPFPVVQGIVGHVSPEMTKHYMDHAGRAAKMQYLAQLPDYLSSAPAPKKSARELTPERIARLIERATPENLPRLKARLLSLLQGLSAAQRTAANIPVALLP